ncbi:hypothetical protein FIBSPDRAFT_881416 [Athelia psychrophila]|uniref:Uncharacterized protein n=1 Tax=Athelia psychrophila TaxID=1759441 RepID=A0A166WN77_9AGAM|nr:hypothetical protein FIBSPDRAFT_881416 [Fibularhizoctonia sp. CBS 109695]
MFLMHCDHTIPIKSEANPATTSSPGTGEYVNKDLAELVVQHEGLEGDAELEQKKEIENANWTIQELDIDKLRQDDLPPSSNLSGPAPNLTTSTSALTLNIKVYPSSNADTDSDVFMLKAEEQNNNVAVM